jgi:hypothetical protein
LEDPSHAPAADPHPRLQERVGQDGPPALQGQTGGRQAPQGQTRHIGGEDHGKGVGGVAQEEGEIPDPKGLVDEGGKAREEKKEGQEDTHEPFHGRDLE